MKSPHVLFWLYLLAEFGGRFESPILKNKRHTPHGVCRLLVTHRGFSSPAIESATGTFSQTPRSPCSRSLEVVSNPRF